MKNYILTAIAIAVLNPVSGQDSTRTEKPFTVSGYLETYYNYDFNKPANNTTPGFLYNFNRAREVNLNLGFIKGSYSTDHVRANLALATGTYVNANYASEPGVLKNMYEANIGFRISKQKNIWIDAGIMPSHIGFESAIGKDNPTLTRSLVAENSPYFESGVKLGFTSEDEKWYLAALYLNGWQRIQRVDGNSTPAFGTQLTFKPSSAVTLNYSTFMGNDKPDSLKQMRYYHNLYSLFQVNEKFGFITGFDLGMERAVNGNHFNHWYTPVVIVHYAVSHRVNVAARGEYFKDKKGVLITTALKEGFQTFGISANIDVAVLPGLLWRLEVRNLAGRDAIFEKNDLKRHNNTFATTSLSFSFQ